MRALEDTLLSVLEFLGFEITKASLGDLFPGALIGFILAAAAGAAVSDWKHSKESSALAELPWDWAASIATFLACIYCWYLIQ